MTFVLNEQHTTPLAIQTAPGYNGYLLIQVLGGPGVWLGSDPQRMKDFRAIDAAPDALMDALYFQQSDGPQFIPWRGPAYLYHPGAASSTAYGSIHAMGCIE